MKIDLIINEIIGFLLEETKLTEEEAEDLTYETDLISCGIIDSIGILELLSFIEEQYSLDLEKISIQSESFRTLDSISKFIVKNSNE